MLLLILLDRSHGATGIIASECVYHCASLFLVVLDALDIGNEQKSIGGLVRPVRESLHLVARVGQNEVGFRFRAAQLMDLDNTQSLHVAIRTHPAYFPLSPQNKPKKQDVYHLNKSVTEDYTAELLVLLAYLAPLRIALHVDVPRVGVELHELAKDIWLHVEVSPATLPLVLKGPASHPHGHVNQALRFLGANCSMFHQPIIPRLPHPTLLYHLGLS